MHLVAAHGRQGSDAAAFHDEPPKKKSKGDMHAHCVAPQPCRAAPVPATAAASALGPSQGSDAVKPPKYRDIRLASRVEDNDYDFQAEWGGSEDESEMADTAPLAPPPSLRGMGGFREFRQPSTPVCVVGRVAAMRQCVLRECNEFTYGLRPERCYLTRNVQKKVDRMVKSWWQKELLDWEYMDDETLARHEKTMWRSWKFAFFGHDWFYWLFVAFGKVDPLMVHIVDELSNVRAGLRRARIIEKSRASSHGESSHGGGLLSMSEQNRAKMLGKPIPEIEGWSVPYNARMRVRMEEERYNDLRVLWQSIYDRGEWTHFLQEQAEDWRRRVDALWDEAEQLSYEGGYEFWDRHGIRRNEGKIHVPPFRDEAAAVYLNRCGTAWKNIRY